MLGTSVEVISGGGDSVLRRAFLWDVGAKNWSIARFLNIAALWTSTLIQKLGVCLACLYNSTRIAYAKLLRLLGTDAAAYCHIYVII